VQVRCQGASETPQLIDPPFKTDSTTTLRYQVLLKDAAPTDIPCQVSNAHARRVFTRHLLSTDAGTDAYTKPLVKPLPSLYHHFLMKQLLVLLLARYIWQIFISSILKQASILIILPCQVVSKLGGAKKVVSCCSLNLNGALHIHFVLIVEGLAF
jgi:hypothetical protein